MVVDFVVAAEADLEENVNVNAGLEGGEVEVEEEAAVEEDEDASDSAGAGSSPNTVGLKPRRIVPPIWVFEISGMKMMRGSFASGWNSAEVASIESGKIKYHCCHKRI